jgi:small subunit ribosomal protein S2
MARVRTSQDEDEKPGQLATDEPLAEWEQELLRGQAAEGTPAPAAGETVEGAGADTAATETAATDTAAPVDATPAEAPERDQA